MSTERSEVLTIYRVYLLTHLTFVLSYRRPILVWRKSANKQRLIKETNEQTPALHRAASIAHLKRKDAPSAPRRAASIGSSHLYEKWRST